jgi:hypothetical protein
MKIKNGFTQKKNGWRYISVKGKPRERGYAYGYFCAKEFKEIQHMLGYFMFESFGYTWEYFIEEINKSFKDITKNDFPEFYEEMEGIAEGCIAGGTDTSINEIIAWNFYMSIPYWFSFKSDTHIGKEGGGRKIGGGGNKSDDKCSAFMAVGDWTSDGKIVVAHNSFTDYIDGQYSNIILDLLPEKGNRFIMQTSPCWIWSGTDFFVTSAGIIGTETTIGGFQPYEEKYPIGYRIRQAMQYGQTLDDYISILLEGNSGDYANSWLLGDTKKNEILRIELGHKYHSLSRTKNGFFIGFNAPYDPRIRNLEVNNSGFYDIRRHQGARRVRLEELMDEHKGKINIDIAKKIISDHYDVYLHKDNNPCSRTVCSHYDLDAREYMSQADRPKPFAPHGAVDGIVCDTKLANKMAFVARFGNSCGIPFNKDEFCKKHIQYANFCPFLKDRPSQPWTEFSSKDFNKKIYQEKLSKTIKWIKSTQYKNDKKLFKNYVKTDGDISSEYYTNENIEYIKPKKNEFIKKNILEKQRFYITKNTNKTKSKKLVNKSKTYKNK